MRATLGERFKILLADAGLTPEQAGKELHVTPRTIRYWISGKVLVPYAAFRLIRILRMYELPQPGWDGWRMHSGRLWSPEGFSFKPDDANWWHLLVRRAQGFGRVYDRNTQLHLALQRLQAGTDDDLAQRGPVDGTRLREVAAGPRCAPAESSQNWEHPVGNTGITSAFPTMRNGRVSP
ncbi:VC1465 family Xer recombination activation factor [Rhodoferax sp. BLA1]|uniref:VC1465 family Xer recombination activation factor n=1 Tax=Rhodoferax sp. BLA1 TaxID=2576062 RepID=UPI0015D16E3E|nr:VC1465 family Xer recombination activation factor [Rhodoferax sp. BLA1]